MKKLLLLSVMAFVALVAYPQSFVSGNLSISESDTIKKKILDHSNYIVTYRYSYSPNAEAPEKKRHGFTDLQIGDRYNMFQDYYEIRYDSVFDAIMRSEGSAMELFAKVSPYSRKQRFDEQILFDKETRELTIFTSINGKTYRYEEDAPIMDWKVVEGDTVIGGYNCNKALTRFAGRYYVAWFTPEIDLPYGPYKFNNLPGLVLQVSDTDNNFTFSLYGIVKDRNNKPVYIPTSESIIKSKRDKVRKIYKNACDDPAKALESDGKVILPEESKRRMKRRPYNPIELE